MPKTLEEIRARKNGLKSRRAELEAEPPPAKWVIQTKSAQIDKALDMICHPDTDLTRLHHNIEISLLLIALCADQLREKIAEHVGKTYPKVGSTPAQRAPELKTIDDELIALDAEEEQLLQAARPARYS